MKGQQAADLDNIRFHIAGNRCDSRYCLFCRRRKAKKQSRTYIPKLTEAIERALLLTGITLTVPTFSTLEWQHYEWIFDRFKMLIQNTPLAEIIVGAVARADLKYNIKRGEYQLHIHSIIVHRDQLPRSSKIRQLWYDLTQGGPNWYQTSDLPETANRSIDVTQITHDEQDPLSTARKITKAISYVCKFTPIADPEAFARYYEVTNDRILTRSYGVLHKNSKRYLGTHLDIGGQESIIQATSESEQMSGERNRDNVQVLEERVKKEWAISEEGAAMLARAKEDAIIEAAQRRLVVMRGASEQAAQAAASERRACRMPTSVECPECKRQMPPNRTLCDICETDAVRSVEQEQSKRA